MLTESKRLRILEIYAAGSMLLIVVLIFSGFSNETSKFKEIDAERINIRDENGALRLVMANKERMPDPIIDGKPFKTERPPGMLFFNGLGDENGGLVYGAVQGKNGVYGAYQGLSFDKYKQAQAMALVYNDKTGKFRAGLHIWDRPEVSLAKIIKRRESIAKMADGDEKNSELEKLRKDNHSPTRVYVGKNKERESVVNLSDGEGKVRIRLVVEESGASKIEFVDANGKVTRSITG